MFLEGSGTVRMPELGITLLAEHTMYMNMQALT